MVQDSQDLESFNCDWMGKYKGQSKLALKPNSTEQVAQILRFCNERKLAVVPQGGNTGLVGGSVPVFDEIVLNLSRMNRVIEVDPVAGVLVCEAGCVLENLEAEVARKGFTMPIDLGAKGSCQIGGNVATNAGGLRLVRYGSLHGTVLGLEAVLPDGTIFDGLSSLRKDNTGYDLKHLLIGSEGTLGVITKVAILLPHKPKAVQVAFLAVDSFQHVLKTMQKAKEDLSDILSAVEFCDRESLQRVFDIHPEISDPLDEKFPFYVLLELSGNSEDQDADRMNDFLSSCFEGEIVSNGTIAQDKTQIYNLWRLREDIPESLSKSGLVFKYDVSVPTSEMYSVVEKMRTRLSKIGFPEERVTGYGHVGDGNLHLNIWNPRSASNEEHLRIEKEIEPYIYELVRDLRGSISAEHGLGAMKASHIHYSKSPTLVNMMKKIKDIFDPNGILNPYKVLP